MIRLFRPTKTRSCITLSAHSISSQLTHVHHYQSTASIEFDSHLYAVTLQKCIQNCDFDSGKRLHCHIIKTGAPVDLFAFNVLLNLYVKSDSLSDASQLFDEMPSSNTVSFTTLAQGYMRSLQFPAALDLFLRLFRAGHQLNPFVFTSILKLLVSMDSAQMCFSIHACIYKLGYHSDAFVGTALIDAYSVCGCVDIARSIFDDILYKDMVTWTGMVACYAENDCFYPSLQLFSHMRLIGYKLNNFLITAVLKSCLGLQAFRLGRNTHACALKTHYEQDLYVGLALLELYSKSQDLDAARQFFEEMPKNDLIPWSLMISRYAQSDKSIEAVELFQRLRQSCIAPNQYTFASVLQACANLPALNLGEQIHSCVLKVGLDSNVFVSNSLMDVYAKCSEMENSMKLFVESPEHNDVTWNTMIVGYVQLGDEEKALNMFVSMLAHPIQPTEVTYSSVLRACASLTSLKQGHQVHSLTIKTIYDKDTVVANSLVDMYAKCGSIRDSRVVFDKMGKRDEVSWNAMICGYSMHGLGVEAVNIFEKMQQSNCKPNKLTFVGVLSGCSNAGLLDKGQALFKSMTQDYGIGPCIEHYTCMVWLPGRSGHLDKAVKLIGEIPFQPSVMVWRALLGACVIHNDIDLGRVCAERVLELDPHDDATHILLSNMYATARRWDSVASIRKIMHTKRVRKEPGLSWIEDQGVVHYFTAGNTSHPDIKLISAMLEWLNMKTREEGYVPNINAVLLDMEDIEKARLLWVHSERLALAFGLIRLPRGSPIHIIKNLRICVDCHIVMKLISKIVRRDIIIRDMNRFHHFQNGICSCGDYWRLMHFKFQKVFISRNSCSLEDHSLYLVFLIRSYSSVAKEKNPGFTRWKSVIFILTPRKPNISVS